MDNQNSDAESDSQNSINNSKKAPVIDITEETSKQNAEVARRFVPDLQHCRAAIYQLFEWDTSNRVWKCKLCPKKFPHHQHSGSTTLNRHAKEKHSKDMTQLKLSATPDTSKGMTMTGFLVPKKSQSQPEPVTLEGFRDKLIAFIIQTDQPFNITENSMFREMLHYVSKANQNVQLPNKNGARSMISTLYDTEQKSLMQEILGNSGKVSLIVDCWTSSNGHAFQGVIASWIDDEWKQQLSLLDLTILEGQHSGENIAGELSNVISEFNLWNKVMAITTDNASNMNTMFRAIDDMALEQGSEFNSDKCRIRCLAHIVNLVCKSILESVEGHTSTQSNADFVPGDEDEEKGTGVISKLRNAIRAIRASPQRRQHYEKMCIRSSLKHRQLIKDVKTRWNSTLDMLLRVSEQRDAFMKTLTLPDLAKYAFTDVDWKIVTTLIEILTPFKESTIIISKARPTLSDTTAVYHILFTHLEKYFDMEVSSTPGAALSSNKRRKVQNIYPQWVMDCTRQGWDKLKVYYPTSDGLIYIAATVLDPRLKLDWYKAIGWDAAWQKQARIGMNNFWTTCYKSKNNTSESQTANEIPSQPSSSTQSSVDKRGDMFEKLLDDKMKKYQKSEDELKQYLSESVVTPANLKDGVMGWWKNNCARFPHLSQMARDVFSAQGTGVSVERLFSSGPDLLTARRQRLSAKSIKQCLSLKCWLKRKECPTEYSEAMEDSGLGKLLGVDHLAPDESN